MPGEARLHINKALSDLSIKVRQTQEEYPVNRVLFPPKNVQKMSDNYYIYTPADSFRTAHDIRANAEESNGLNQITPSNTVYTMAEHSLHTYVSDRDRDNADAAVDPEMDAMEDVTMTLLRNKEMRAAEAIWTSTAYGSGNLLTLSSNAWDLNTTTSSPITDTDTARRDIIQNTAKVPNGFVIGEQGKDVLKNSSEILDRVKWSEMGIITTDLLASVFGVTNFTVSTGLYRSTAPGISATVNFIFNNNALMYFNEPNPRLRSTNFGITFQRQEPTFRRIRDDHRQADKLEQSWFYDQKVVLSTAGFFFKSVHS